MKILIIGDSCIDKFIYGNVNRLNPEAPTQIFCPSYEIENPGMAANVAEHFKHLNIKYDFITNFEHIYKIRYIDEASNYILLRVDKESLIFPLCEQIDLEFYDFILISDYNKGFLTQDYLESLIFNAIKQNKLVFLDTKKELGDWSQHAWIKINEKEFLQNKKNNFNKEKTIITMGKAGVRYKDKIIAPEIEITTRDVVGAGDTFQVFFSLYFYKTRDVILSIKKANHYAGIACSSKGVKSNFIEKEVDSIIKTNKVE